MEPKTQFEAHPTKPTNWLVHHGPPAGPEGTMTWLTRTVDFGLLSRHIAGDGFLCTIGWLAVHFTWDPSIEKNLSHMTVVACSLVCNPTARMHPMHDLMAKTNYWWLGLDPANILRHPMVQCSLGAWPDGYKQIRPQLEHDHNRSRCFNGDPTTRLTSGSQIQV